MEPVEIHNAIPQGSRVRIEQTIELRDRSYQTAVEGQVLQHHREATGSWHAHGKNDKLWLDVINLRKDDGEISKLVLDRNSRVILLDGNK